MYYADRVLETTTTTGTGTLSLGGAVAGYRTFLTAFSSGSTVYYLVYLGTNWEIGMGTVTSGAPNTLSRTTVYSSSNAGSLVNFPAGTKQVCCVIPSIAMVGMLRNGSGAVFRSGGNSTTTGFQISSGADLATVFNLGFKTAQANRNAGTSGSGAGIYRTYTLEQGTTAENVRLAETTVNYVLTYCSYCTYCTYCTHCTYCNCVCG